MTSTLSGESSARSPHSMRPEHATLTYAPALYQVKVPLQAGLNKITATFRGAGSGFGGGGATGFTPSYLVSYDAPVAFTVKGMKPNCGSRP